MEMVRDALMHSDHEPGELFSGSPITVYIPKFRKSNTWYLERLQDTSDVIYSFRDDESPSSILKFSVINVNGEHEIVVSATKSATGSLIPTFFINQIPIELNPRSLEGEPIAVDREIIYSDLKIAT